MAVTSDFEHGVRIIKPIGDLAGNQLTLEYKAAALSAIAAGDRKLLIDMASVPYISSAGISATVEIRNEMKQTGGRLALCNLEHIQTAFIITKITNGIPTYESREDAMSSFG